MEISKEIKKVQELLKIPVSDLEFTGTNRVTVYSDEDNIGGIPCYIVAGIYSYEASGSAVNWLEWGKVFKRHSDEICSLIRKVMGRDDILCQHQLFRQVRVSEHEIDNKGDNVIGHQLALYECSFENGKWTIQLLD